jgi:iron complex outermembrane receptor protein
VTGAFFDLDNLQVLRGPQGVRFGRVTDGGALLISPKKPTDDFGGYVEAGLGDYTCIVWAER